ncbi:GNA1162 family protein [Marseilla massiliensis]|jgi:hypothetical protein|uniref:DUF799 family lipoprotein n=1 Tax=Marseilla massiliensis TaxID=1841864 RepID=A0A938WVQ0_9BACT|nr:GNA1162 family protein [Marseilla massiliensis]MBM6674205.1 DUF799 family lipoprotein [Marseilla massiliensis]
MKKNILLAVISLLLVSCSQKITRDMQYPKMYEEKPVSIVIMPPINQTQHVEAKDYFYTTMFAPLCEKGYYVFSPLLTMELFQSESAYDAEQFIEADLSQFRNVLGADAAMFTIIKSWKRNNIGGKLTVDVEYILRSTKTNETLYRREGNIKVDTSVSGGGGGVFGALVNLAATAISTATTDKVIAGRRCTAYVLSDMPVGKYDTELYGKDQKLPAGKSFVKATVK